MHHARRTLAATTALAALLLAGCGGDPGAAPDADTATDVATDASSEPIPAPDQTDNPEAPADATAEAPAEPTPDPAPPSSGSGSGPRPPIATLNPELGWPLEEDHARLMAFPALVDAAFDAGAEAGLRFLAERAWPDGFTADALLACRTSEPTPTYAELDADGFRYRIEFRPVSTVPYFQYPPTGEYPLESGLRSYLGRLIVVTEEDGVAVSTFDDIARLAVRADGTVVMYPTCFEFLPGELLDHRVTDGHIGGYTDAEAEGDIRAIFLGSPAHLQDEVCAYLDDGVLDGADLDDLAYMIMPPDIEFSDASIPRDVMERTVTELCLARVS